MAKKEKKWFGVTRSPEEDLALVDIIRASRSLTVKRFLLVMVMSLFIITVYMLMNREFFPGYPVVTEFAEKNEQFVKHYPPFRMYEWVNYSVTMEILEGRLYDNDSFSRIHPVGYSMLAAPLTGRWGERGMFYTNAFLLWISAIVFFFLMLEMVEFRLAIAATLILALATPNLFFASSAFSEPAAQLITVLAVFLFVKGMMAQREWIYYLLCGFITGLNLFVQPAITLMVFLFAGLLLYERGKFSLSDRNILCLCAGFLVPLVVFLTVNRIFLGEFGVNIFLNPVCDYNLTTQSVSGESGNIIAGILKLLFDNPYGLVFIMPAATLVPMGIIVMWRNELRFITIIVGVLLLYTVFLTAAGLCPVTGESVGSRQLVPVIPLLVLPLAFIWREQIGEKLWLVAALILTVYICSFGWWTGVVRGKGIFIGALQDREARYIILARKNIIGQPDFRSSNELAEIYINSLKKGDIKCWLQTLNRNVLREIQGFERPVFKELCRKINAGAEDRELFIEYIDPNGGIRPVLPELNSIKSISDK